MEVQEAEGIDPSETALISEALRRGLELLPKGHPATKKIKYLIDNPDKDVDLEPDEEIVMEDILNSQLPKLIEKAQKPARRASSLPIIKVLKQKLSRTRKQIRLLKARAVEIIRGPEGSPLIPEAASRMRNEIRNIDEEMLQRFYRDETASSMKRLEILLKEELLSQILDIKQIQLCLVPHYGDHAEEFDLLSQEIAALKSKLETIRAAQ